MHQLHILFFDLLTGDMKEHTSTDIVLHDMDPAAVELLIEYGYTGQIVITPENVQVLLPASSILQMSTVREACCRFLMKQLHPTNCLGIRSFAGKISRNKHTCKYVPYTLFLAEITHFNSYFLPETNLFFSF